jgi:hypothetical protein
VASYLPGDQVVCLVKAGVILHANEVDFDFKYIFDIASQYDQGYMVYVPATLHLKDVIVVTASNCFDFNLSKKFIGSSVYYITDYRIVYLHRKMDGMSCASCGEFYPMANSNQPDGTLKCWNCRNYKFYK